MKRIFSLLLLAFCFSVSGRDIILVENMASREEGAALIKIIEGKFNIPKSMITFKSTMSCMKDSEAIMHLCLKPNGELDVVKVNRFVVKNSLSAFYENNSMNIKETN